MIIVCDSSPIIALAICNKLELLDKMFIDVLIPQEVYYETTREGKTPTPMIEKWVVGKVVEVKDRQTVNQFNLTLDKGEAEAVTLYLEKSADYLLIDEKKGRKIASEKGLNIIGSLGILILAKRKGLIQSIKPSIELIQSSATRISDILYEYALRMAGE